MKSPKQSAWLRYVESRWADKWGLLDEATRNALKQSWFAGWAACQYRMVNRKEK